MQYKSVLFTSALVVSSLAAYVPSEPWSTLTPSASAPSGALTDYSSTFGIAVIPLASATHSSKAKRDVISQIGDGQIQASTATPSTTKSSSVAPKSTAQAISQIGDGQIQASTATSSASKSTVTAASQISDGQVQASTASISSALASASASHASDDSDPVDTVSCKEDGSLALTLKKGILTDSHGRIGSIVANRQFQFDGPPPQAGAIYAAGWSITEEGVLALGDSDKFYQCLSGNFYNLYDESIGAQCHEIKLEVVDLIDC